MRRAVQGVFRLWFLSVSGSPSFHLLLSQRCPREEMRHHHPVRRGAQQLSGEWQGDCRAGPGGGWGGGYGGEAGLLWPRDPVVLGGNRKTGLLSRTSPRIP